jgi:hypothetical protein
MAIFNSLCLSLDEMLEKYPDNSDIVIDVFVNQMRHSRWMNEQIIEVLSQFKHCGNIEIQKIIIKTINELTNDKQW